MDTEDESEENKTLYGPTFSTDTVRMIANSVGINELTDDAAYLLADDVSTKIKGIVQDALKFMNHSRRDRLLTSHIDSALNVRNFEVHNGFLNKVSVPFRFASGGNRELFMIEDKELDLKEIANSLNAKIPIGASIRTHWLAIDGVQPNIPENPLQLPKDDQIMEAINPVLKLDIPPQPKVLDNSLLGRNAKLRNYETVLVKQLAIHELSAEKQLYYREITEACVGTDEQTRSEALHSLACDPGLHDMVPRVCNFISEGIKVNAALNNLAMLIYLIRMVKALLDNSNFYIERYLHELIPPVITCIVSKQLCMRPEQDNHWALRDFSARLMARICRTYNTSTNSLQTRTTRIFLKALNNERIILTSIYGATIGFCELGPEVVKAFLLPNIRRISECIETKLSHPARSSIDKDSAERIRTIILQFCVPILLQIRASPDFVEEYKSDYGEFLGLSLFLTVLRSRASNHLPMGNMGSYRMKATPRHE